MICDAYIYLCGQISIEWTPSFFLFHSMQSTIDKYKFTNAENLGDVSQYFSHAWVIYKINSKILIQRDISGTPQPQERVIKPNGKPVMS